MADRIVWSHTALDDLRSIVEFISQDSPDRARNFGIRIISEVESILTFPNAGRSVPEYRSPKIREIIVRPYRIVYRVNEANARVEIARIWHAARGKPGIS